MRIGVDVMGGDNAPDEILKGCFASLAKLEPTDTLVLLGDEAIIRDTMMERRITDARIEVVHCSEVIIVLIVLIGGHIHWFHYL